MSFGVDATTLSSSASQTSQTDSPTNLRQFANLNLTEDQRTKLRAILQQAKANGTSQADLQTQINAVLTDAQKTTLQQDLQQAQTQSQSASPTAAPSGSFGNGPLANLNLTSDQQSKIQSILQSAQSQGLSQSDVRQQIDAVLTDTQKAQLQQNVQNAHSHGSGRHRHASGSGDTSSSSTATSTNNATLPNGLTEADILNQVLAAGSLVNQQVQSNVTTG